MLIFFHKDYFINVSRVRSREMRSYHLLSSGSIGPWQSEKGHVFPEGLLLLTIIACEICDPCLTKARQFFSSKVTP